MEFAKDYLLALFGVQKGKMNPRQQVCYALITLINEMRNRERIDNLAMVLFEDGAALKAVERIADSAMARWNEKGKMGF